VENARYIIVSFSCPSHLPAAVLPREAYRNPMGDVRMKDTSAGKRVRMATQRSANALTGIEIFLDARMRNARGSISGRGSRSSHVRFTASALIRHFASIRKLHGRTQIDLRRKSLGILVACLESLFLVSLFWLAI